MSVLTTQWRSVNELATSSLSGMRDVVCKGISIAMVGFVLCDTHRLFIGVNRDAYATGSTQAQRPAAASVNNTSR